jgi:branched-chain amino acid transport system permease protein
MTLFLSAVTAGLLLGGTFSLIALGLVLLFRATRTFNFAHGELMLLPAFIVGDMQAHHAPLLLSIVLALVIGGGIGAAFYFLVLRRTTGLPIFMGIIATFGLAAILDGAMNLIFGANQFQISIGALPSNNLTIAGAHISETAIVLTVLTLALALIVVVIMRYTHLGVMVRAAGQDPVLASQCGIPIGRIYAGSWIAAAVLAAIAGISYGCTSTVNTDLTALPLAAIPAIVLGGMDSVEGAVVGGVVIGLVQSFAQVYLGGLAVNVITYSLLLVGLLLYPQGLFGTKEVVRA